MPSCDEETRVVRAVGRMSSRGRRLGGYDHSPRSRRTASRNSATAASPRCFTSAAVLTFAVRPEGAHGCAGRGRRAPPSRPPVYCCGSSLVVQAEPRLPEQRMRSRDGSPRLAGDPADGTSCSARPSSRAARSTSASRDSPAPRSPLRRGVRPAGYPCQFERAVTHPRPPLPLA
jgi:hypothetical protein